MILRKYIFSPILRILSPGYGTCESCKCTWNYVKGKCIEYSLGGGCFPICESCFNELPFDKVKYYYISWVRRNERFEIIPIGWSEEKFIQLIKYEYGVDRIRESKIDQIIS